MVALNPTRSVDELTRDARATDVDVLLWDEPYETVARESPRGLGAVAASSLRPRRTGAPGATPMRHDAVRRGPVRWARSGEASHGLAEPGDW